MINQKRSLVQYNKTLTATRPVRRLLHSSPFELFKTASLYLATHINSSAMEEEGVLPLSSSESSIRTKKIKIKGKKKDKHALEEDIKNDGSGGTSSSASPSASSDHIPHTEKKKKKSHKLKAKTLP